MSFEGIIMGIIFIILVLCDCGIILSFILSIILGMIVCFIIGLLYDATRSEEEKEEMRELERENRRAEIANRQTLAEFRSLPLHEQEEIRRAANITRISRGEPPLYSDLSGNASQNKCKLCGQPVPDGIEICYVCMMHIH